MKQEDQLNIQAWLDSEIAPQKAKKIVEQMESSSTAQALAEELKAVESALKIGEKPIFLDDTRDFYWSQIERQINAEAPMPTAEKPPEHVQAASGNLMRWLVPTGSLVVISALMLNFHKINPTGSDRSSEEAIIPSTAGGRSESDGIMEEERTDFGVGILNFQDGLGLRNLPNQEDPSMLPESIENPDR